MSYEDKIVKDVLIELKSLMRKAINRKVRGKVYYELRIKEHKFEEAKFILLKLYQEAFKQGVYTAK
jgi:hypothetical protein